MIYPRGILAVVSTQRSVVTISKRFAYRRSMIWAITGTMADFANSSCLVRLGHLVESSEKVKGDE